MSDWTGLCKPDFNTPTQEVKFAKVANPKG